MSTNSALPLTEVRARAATALAPALPSDPTVHVEVVDAVAPPAILLVWADPWLTLETFPSGTFGSGLFTAQLTVLCIAARVEPGPGVAKLEELVTYTISRLQADTYPWPPASSQAPRQFPIAGVNYLGARVTYAVPVQIGGTP